MDLHDAIRQLRVGKEKLERVIADLEQLQAATAARKHDADADANVKIKPKRKPK